jgi:hypothetical protein
MGERACIVCGKKVPDGYQMDHLRSNHLGPHYFWFDAKRYTTMEPSMSMSEVKRLAGTSPMYQAYEERNGGDIPWGDAQSVDLTHEPHFYAAPPATMFG